MEKNLSIFQSIYFKLYECYREIGKAVNRVKKSQTNTNCTDHMCLHFPCSQKPPQWEATDAEIKVPSDENTELKGSPFKAGSRSVYCHACYTYCQGVLPCFLSFQSIHLHFFQNFSRVFHVLAVANTDSCVGPQNEIGHPAGCWFPC